MPPKPTTAQSPESSIRHSLSISTEGMQPNPLPKLDLLAALRNAASERGLNYQEVEHQER